MRELRLSADVAAGWCSRSHSRAMAAAAVSAEGPVGIDVEWTGACGDLGGLAAFLLGEVKQGADPHRLYQLWTFREAHFKAFGVFPARAALRALFEAAPDWETPFGWGGAQGLFHRAPCDFVICVLGAGSGAPTLLEARPSPPQAAR